MANLVGTLKNVFQLPGCVGTVLIDIQTGVCVAQIGSQGFDIGNEAASYANTLRLQERLVKQLRLQQSIQEIVFTTDSNYHILIPFQLRILRGRPPERLFFYVVLSKKDTNLSSASLKIRLILSEFVF